MRNFCDLSLLQSCQIRGLKSISNRCDDGLKIQKKLIKHDLKEYQRELEKNYHTFLTHMRPLFGQTSHHQAGGSPR